MNNQLPITKDYFVRRLTDLCLKSGLTEFPKDERDQHILLKSAVLMMGSSTTYTEREINEILETWVRNVSQIKNVDRVTLRRRLVDTGYLTRSKDGSQYQTAPSGEYADRFDPAIEQIDPIAVISNAREEIARRKREFLEKARKG